MIRPVRADGSIDTGGAFLPVVRPRLIERFALAARLPIVVVAASAGFGKSVALGHHLEGRRDPWVRFDLTAEHRSLLGFLDGLSAALLPIAAHARSTLPGAYERSRESGRPIESLALWMQAHLANYRGTIVLDDLHVADGDPEVAAFVGALIARGKGTLRWIVATRSHAHLPVGSWLAYGDADLPIDERDLAFSFEEAKQAAKASRLAMRDQELRELLMLTQGWPTALGFALRGSTRAADLRAVAATTRELAYRFLAEQVYADLTDDERDLLAVAVLLPTIEVGLLERAGFDRAADTIERLRARTACLYPDPSGAYRTHELFRDFVHAQLERSGSANVERAYRRAARALEASGDVASALGAFTHLRAEGDVRRLLAHAGLTLLESAQGERVERALAILPQAQLQSDALVLLLRGVVLAAAGRGARAESLFRRAIARAGSGAGVVVPARLRLALLLVNAGRDAREVLAPIANDPQLSSEVRGEALSILALHDAPTATPAATRARLAEVERLLGEIDADAVRAKVLQRLGLALKEIGAFEAAEAALRAAAELADEGHLHSLASRARASLASLRLQEYDDVDRYLELAQRSYVDAQLAGDIFDLQMAQLRVLDAMMRRGDAAAAVTCETALMATGIRESPLWVYLATHRGMRAGWEGRFEDGLRELSAVAGRLHYGFDRLLAHAHAAVFAAFADKREASIAALETVAQIASEVETRGSHRLRSVALARMWGAFAEVVLGRTTRAARWAAAIRTDGDAVADVAVATARALLSGVVRGTLRTALDATAFAARFEGHGYGDVARLLSAIGPALSRRIGVASEASLLTPAEIEVLRQLAAGRRPKEIASALGRSIYTVQSHVANAAAKLGCHGRTEAIATARIRGLLA